MCTPAIGNLIREGKTFQIPSAMQTGRGEGMQTLDAAILELLNDKRIDPATAYERAINRELIIPFLPEDHPARS